jgi:hypothetical protein
MAFLGALNLTGRAAAAADVISTWIGANGNWSVPTNWDSGVPDNAGGNTFTAIINNGSTVTLDISPFVQALGIDFLAPPASTLILGAGQSLSVTDLLFNGNVVTVNSSGGVGALDIGAGGTAFNGGTLLASGGGTLELRGPGGFGVVPANITIDNTGGTITAQNGSVVKLEGALITGGTLTTSGTGVIQPDLSDVALQDLTNAGFYRVQGPFVNTHLRGAVTNTGTFAMDLPFDGVLTVDPGAILGNNGTLLASGGGTLMVQGPGTINNTGTFEAEAGSTLELSSVGFRNFDATTGTLSGGAYRVTGTLIFDGANIVTNAATIVLDTSGSSITDEVNQDALRNFAANTGSFALQGGRSLATPADFTNSGTMAIAANSLLNVAGLHYVQTGGTTLLNGELATGSLVDIRGGTLSGSGLVVNNLNNGGTVSPGNSPGTLFVTGDYRQTATGILDIEIGGLLAGVQYDVLRVFGDAFLDGLLDVSLIGGFDPTADATFDILVAGFFVPGSVSGTFATLDLPTSSIGTWNVEYLSDRVRIDFAVGGTGNVPEPSTIALMIVALGILAIVQRQRRLTAS